jgi:hypothetical protein
MCFYQIFTWKLVCMKHFVNSNLNYFLDFHHLIDFENVNYHFFRFCLSWKLKIYCVAWLFYENWIFYYWNEENLINFAIDSINHCFKLQPYFHEAFHLKSLSFLSTHLSDIKNFDSSLWYYEILACSFLPLRSTRWACNFLSKSDRSISHLPFKFQPSCLDWNWKHSSKFGQYISCYFHLKEFLLKWMFVCSSILGQ